MTTQLQSNPKTPNQRHNMYVIEYEGRLYAAGEKKETFNCSQVLDFFERVKELRDLGLIITNTYFID